MSLTLSEFGRAKRFSERFLSDQSITETRYGGGAAVKFTYMDEAGAVSCLRYRIALTGKDRFRYRKGDKACLYGLWRLEFYSPGCAVHLVEGESDALTLWLHNIPALGVPGVECWKHEWSAHFEQFNVIYAWIEPDGGGANFEASLRSSPLASRLRLIRPGVSA